MIYYKRENCSKLCMYLGKSHKQIRGGAYHGRESIPMLKN